MQSTSEMIFSEVMKLPENERLVLASRILDTVPADDSAMSLDDASLVEELDRRFADPAQSVAWSDLLAEEPCRPTE